MATDAKQFAENTEAIMNAEQAKAHPPAFPPALEKSPVQGETTARDHLPGSTMTPRPHRDSPATAPRVDEKGRG